MRPKPPAFPSLSSMTRPAIIEEDIVEYLVRASLEQRWRILSRVAVATRDEPARASSPPPASERRTMPAPVPESEPLAAGPSLEAALRLVACVAGLVHLRDPRMGDLVVVHAHGPRADRLLRTRAQVDASMTHAANTGKPAIITYGDGPGAEKTMCSRHVLFDPWSVALVPVTHGGQLLGLIEMIDPTDGNPFDESALAALAEIGTRLGRFVAEHGPTDSES